MTAAVLEDNFPPPARLLELGAAKGYFLLAALQAGYSVVGLDASTYASGTSGGLVTYADVTNGIDYPNGIFDLVVSFEFLEHIDPTRIRALVSDMDRVLKPGGVQVHRVGILIPGREDEFYSDSTHVLPLTKDEWVQLWNGYDRLFAVEEQLDEAFSDRDWSGRFLAFRKPED